MPESSSRVRSAKGETDEVTVTAVLRARAGDRPDHVFVVDGGGSLTYAELERRSAEVALGLLRLGVGHGDRVATWMGNSIDWVVVTFALARLGAINVLVNTRYTEPELRHVLEASGASVLVFDDAVVGADLRAVVEGMADRPTSLRHLVRTGAGAEPGLLQLADLAVPLDEVGTDELAAAEHAVRPGDALYITFTSGTTGVPKGSLSSQGAVVRNGRHAAEAEGAGPDTRLLGYLPLHHCFGSTRAVFGVLAMGSTLVLLDVFRPEAVLRSIAEHRITTLYGVPTNYLLLLEARRAAEDDYDLSSLSHGLIGAGEVTPELATAIRQELGITYLTNGYGMTEATALISQTRWDWPEEERVASVGEPVPGCELRIVREGTAEVEPTGTAGAIQVRGYNVHLGYHGLPASASPRTADGWFITGDIGCLDERGRLHFLGRRIDMYKSAGFNVYPAEVEAVLEQHPAIAASAVVGVPDPLRLEVGVAFVRLRPAVAFDPVEVHAFLRARLARFKLPVELVVVDEIPVTGATAKVQKHVLRDRWVEARVEVSG